MAHVVAVAEVGEGPAAQRPEVLAQGEQVGERLAGMLRLGEGVDDRDARRLGELGEPVVAQHPDRRSRRRTATAVCAMSASGSRLPRPISAPVSVVVPPPRRWIPTSNETRVRRLGLSNTSATQRPARSAAAAVARGERLEHSACSTMSVISTAVEVGDGEEMGDVGAKRGRDVGPHLHEA